MILKIFDYLFTILENKNEKNFYKYCIDDFMAYYLKKCIYIYVYSVLPYSFLKNKDTR